VGPTEPPPRSPGEGALRPDPAASAPRLTPGAAFTLSEETEPATTGDTRRYLQGQLRLRRCTYETFAFRSQHRN